MSDIRGDNFLVQNLMRNPWPKRHQIIGVTNETQQTTNPLAFFPELIFTAQSLSITHYYLS